MVLELGSSFEVVKVTAQYSNAVLVAVLPYISDAAQKLGLPVPHPVTTSDVVCCSVLPNRRLEAEVGVRGDWVFAFRNGFVDTIQSRRSYSMLQNPDEIPKYYGELKMTAGEAVHMARDALEKLAIPLEYVFAEQEPRVDGPYKFGTNTVPYYHVAWLDPRGGPSAEIEVNGNVRRLERLSFRCKALERAPPAVSVVPSRDPRFPVWPQVSPDYAWRLLPIVLRAIEEYAQKLSLGIPSRLTTNHVALFSVVDNGGWPHAEIELTNGWRFIYRNSMVNGFYAPDNLFHSDKRAILIKDFVGKWNMTQAQAIELIGRTIAKLNYPANLVHMNFEPQVHKPALPGIPRYSFWWWYENEAHDDVQSKVEAEVDADKRELKSLYYDDKSFWSHPPPVHVPMVLPATTDHPVTGFRVR